ncbi:trypsin-like peptidase domain-containing protein [Streptomyces sp. DG2A-72]|uniref:trypsin-like peptidase domain-containing protein n=1 Tax=Streptomyces sp. DG2A-72 TaxID=3051386 RepID=UPI00265C6FDE|nr:trypsin-like peptidase domain-containing protein [Streptomyces sp. DG2A-72]MDO0936115.1 trypsin-like peptidase domain-containing protein [Streptomyces sp. DG2A-72]
MNEGKPTKSKWWSRPRPQPPADVAQGASPTQAEATPPEAADGDFESARLSGVGGGGRASGDGDFELDRPAGSRGGDFELEQPAGGRGDTGSAEGDFELRLPAEAGAEDDFVRAQPSVTPVSQADRESTTERPKPLHDPDPYSTPPYGEPGPWAPAPPVQHPATTPAEGTPTPAATQDTSAPTRVPTPTNGTPAPAPTTTPAHGTSAPVPNPPPTPIPALPPAAPAPTAPAPPTTPFPPPANPWQNYDPWAPVTGPLQQNGAAVPTTTQRRKRARKALLGGALLLALVSGGVGGAVGAYLERNGGVGSVELPQADVEPTGRPVDSVAGIAARALPSVVTLHVSGSEAQGTGTGFVLDDRGHILTNNHVVEPAGTGGEISVTFHSGDTAKATVVGRDGGYDLAVVKVSGVTGLKPMRLGNSDNVQVGDPVVAIGAPFDLAGTVTSGIISAKERPITAGGESGDRSDVSYVDALQTDAPINPGNSGGPLLDAEARVIGINSAIRSAGDGSDLDGGQAGSIGLGFAIPVNQAKHVAEELINTGKATHPVIGVTLDMGYAGDGARVGTEDTGGGPAVNAGGPGDKAGIKAGDVITEVDGQRIHSGEELIVKTRAHRPGDRLELTLERDGKEIRIALVLGSSDAD